MIKFISKKQLVFLGFLGLATSQAFAQGTNRDTRLLLDSANGLYDGSYHVTGVVQADKWVELVGQSTPTTPSAKHARVYLSSSTERLCTIFDNSSITCVGGTVGTITGVTAGNGLTGGGTSGSVTLTLDPNSTDFIQNTGVPSTSTQVFKVSSGTVTGTLIANAAYIGPGSIGNTVSQPVFRTDAVTEFTSTQTKTIVSMSNTVSSNTFVETAFTFGAYDSLNNLHQTGSIFSGWGGTNPNAVNSETASEGYIIIDPKFNNELSSRDMQVFGKTGIYLLNPVLQTIGPGAGIVAISSGGILSGTFNVDLQATDSAGSKGLNIGYDTSGVLGAIACQATSCGTEFWTNNGSALANRLTLTSAGNLSFADTTKGIVGTISADNAGAGLYGETVSSVTAVDFKTLSSGVWSDIAQVSLTAGDWLLSGIIEFDGAAIVVTQNFGAISSTQGNSATGQVQGDNLINIWLNTSATDSSGSIPSWRQSFNTTTTYYLKAKSTISSGTQFAFGRISAVRIR